MASALSKFQGKRSHLLIASLTLGAASLGIASCGYPASSASTDSSSNSTAILECTSGTITNGDIQTSSLFVAKLPADILDSPGGCTVRTN